MEHSGIKTSHLTTAYAGTVALDDVSVTLPAGEIIGIIGPNGAGKSTFLKSVLDLIPHAGSASFNDQPVTAVRPQIAYVEQRSSMDLTFPINVLETVLLGTYPELGLVKRPGKAERQRAAEALAEVEMSAFQDAQIGELSGGQLQRVLIARVIAQDADWIFLDEPFVGIDIVSEKIIIDRLKALRDSGKTILIVHHDLSKVADYFDSLVILNKTLITAGPVDETFNREQMREAYGNDFPF